MKCITFRRSYWDRVVSSTYLIETDAHKLALAHFIMVERKGEFAKEFICGRFEHTLLHIACDSGQVYHLKHCVQFFDDGMFYVDGQDSSLTFPFSSDEERLAFANWVIEHKWGTFATKMHMSLSQRFTSPSWVRWCSCR